ncbi:MAG: arylesterase [Methylococcales bacterium]|nr:arylesterase [Methylococcales bacterium]
MFKFIWAVILLISSSTLLANTIVVLGDSLSASHGIEVQQGWVSLLQKKLNTTEKKYQIINESVSGETSAGGLARIDKILNDYKPSVLILELGANDGLRGLSPKIMKKNLAEIIHRSQKHDVNVLLLSMRIPPNYGKRYTDLFYKVYPQLKNDLKVTLVPFILNDVALMKGLMQKDGLHPNAKAQPLIMDKIWPYLKKLLVNKDK